VLSSEGVMKQLLKICLFSLFVGACSHTSNHIGITKQKASLQKVSSSFGFDIDVPQTWLVLTADVIREGNISIESLKNSRVDKSSLKKVFPAILGGQSEMFFIPYAGGETGATNDNVNIISSIGFIPEKEVLNGLCEATEEQLTLVFVKPTKLESCEYRKFGKVISIYIEFDGLLKGTKNAQYHAYDINNNTNDLYIVFSITALKSNFIKINRALQDSLKTVYWHKP
jgi:hypothetical protein